MEPEQIIQNHQSDDNFPSRLSFARYLNQLYPERSVKGWEMQLIRKEYTHEVDAPYEYDQAKDIYTTRCGKHVVKLTGDEHRSIIKDYSAGYTGNEICLKYDMLPAVFQNYRRVHQLKHGGVPISKEQLLADDEEVLVDEILASRKVQTEITLERKANKRMRESAEKWEYLSKNFLSHVTNLPKANARVPKLKLPESPDPYALVVCPTDFHWGKHGWSDEVGETYNFDEARSRLMTKTQTLVNRLPSRPEKIFVGAGSDWFHVDNDAGTTTKGTPQDMCASPAEILITGCQLAREHIDLLRQIAPVEIVMMPGNHDRHSSLALMMYLSAAYEDVPDVSVTITANNRRYIQYGDTLLGFTHGDGMSKRINIVGLMAVEAREKWGATKHKVWFHGHLHHQRLAERDGCLIVQMPSLAGHDRYHARSGYTTSTAGLAAYFIDQKEGYLGSLFAPVTHGE